MLRAPSNPPWDGMPDNAISYGSPVDLIGSYRDIARAICAACVVQHS
jgi:hypothetical protein